MAFQTYVLQTPICKVTSTGDHPLSVFVNGVYIGVGSSTEPSSYAAIPASSDASQRIIDRVRNLPAAPLSERRAFDDASDRMNRAPAESWSGSRGATHGQPAANDYSRPRHSLPEASTRTPLPVSKWKSTIDGADDGTECSSASSQRSMSPFHQAIRDTTESGTGWGRPYMEMSTPNAKDMKAHNKHQMEIARKSFKQYGSLGKKRKSGDFLADDIAHYKQKLYINLDLMYTDSNCDQVRSLINKVLDSGIMKRSELSEVLGCSNTAVANFLKRDGHREGEKSEVYRKAWVWFKQREVAGLKMPDVRKRLSTEIPVQKASTPTTAGSSRGTPATLPNLPDVSRVHLDGEDTDEVPVYDTCDEVRRKIDAHFSETPGLTQAQFCRDLYQQFNQPKVSGIQTVQLSTFRGKSGPRAGNMSSVFYTAYVYFEKLRIARGRPKSEHREKMESIWAGQHGFETKTNALSAGATGSADHELAMDQYGRVS